MQCNYFIAGSGKTNAKGALYTKYNNQIRYYRCKGLIEATPKRTKVSVESQQIDNETESYSDQELTSVIELKHEVCDTEEIISWINIFVGVGFDLY